jgi:bifunctional UDP-N-acetylglucosamine pyrophosphorylase/glucosamine-1-phosphate N-acetyltransferase
MFRRGVASCAAVVLAAGKGTRMGSALPKVLHSFRGEALVVHPVRAAIAAGADPIVLVVGHGADAVERCVRDAFGGAGPRLRFALQAEQLGTGHAVLCALDELRDVDGPTLVLSGDVPLVRRETLDALVLACSRNAGALATFAPADRTGYGRILRDANGDVIGIREHRDASPAEREIAECNAGLYCIDAQRLRAILPTVRRDNDQGEIYLTDVVAPLAAQGTVIGLPIPELEAAGVNTKDELARLEAAFPMARE